jgi:hypothetical protein
LNTAVAPEIQISSLYLPFLSALGGIEPAVTIILSKLSDKEGKRKFIQYKQAVVRVALLE